MLSPPRWRRINSWICGWLYVVGNITITLAVNFGTALFIVSCVNVFESAPGVGVFAGEPYQVFLVFLALTLLCNAVSALGNRWLPWLDVRPTPPSRIPSPCEMFPADCASRLLPSTGPLLVCLLSLFPFWLLPRMVAMMPSTSSLILRRLRAGLRAGPFALVCSMQAMPPRRPE